MNQKISMQMDRMSTQWQGWKMLGVLPQDKTNTIHAYSCPQHILRKTHTALNDICEPFMFSRRFMNSKVLARHTSWHPTMGISLFNPDSTWEVRNPKESWGMTLMPESVSLCSCPWELIIEHKVTELKRMGPWTKHSLIHLGAVRPFRTDEGWLTKQKARNRSPGIQWKA